jgi:hypothetical protein
MTKIMVDGMEMEVVVQLGELLPPTHSIRILWGSASHREADSTICEYRFATKELLNAFCIGVEAAVGYMDYGVIDR